MMLTDKAMHDRMANGWRGGLPGTICGVGSTLENTRLVRAWLPDICQRYDIHTLNDAGAGDVTWIRRVQWRVDYIPFDLVPRLPEVIKIDITREVMPPCDAILCRHTLNHIYDRVEAALDLFCESARYLICTQFDRQEIDHREFTRLDLRKYLGEPLESIEDGGAEGCRMAIWNLAIP